MENSRVIKFRAWDGEDMYSAEDQDDMYWFECGINQMYLYRREQYFETGSGVADEQWRSGVVDNAVFMQFTGLLDKNGKEIYESDLIEYDTGTPDERFAASIVFKGARFLMEDVTDKFPYVLEEWHGDIEVVGNTHENPELLEEL